MPRLEHPNTTGSVTSLSANTGIVTTALGVLDTISLTTDGAVVIGNGSGPILESGATLRTSLGVGTGNSPQFTALSLTTPLPVSSGGTGGATAATGRAGLGLSSNHSPAFEGLTVNDTGASTNDILFKVQDNSSSVFTVDKEGDVVVSGGLTVQGTATYIESTTIQVDDKNLELGAVETPTDLTADGGGIILKGPTNSDKTILWENDTDTWNFNQGIKVTTGSINLATALAIADGGTGATTATAAASALGVGTEDSPQFTALTTTASLDLQGERIQLGGSSNNGVINSNFSFRINIDSDNSATNESFTIGNNQQGIDNNNILFQVM